VTNGQGKILIKAATLQEAIDRADESYPGFRERVLDGNGEIKRFINVFVNGVDVRKLQGRSTPVQDGDEVAVIPAMAGGSGDQEESPVLVSADWLNAHCTDPTVRILDVRVSDPRLPMGYRMGHVPNAMPFDLNQDVFDVSGRTASRLKSPEAIAAVLSARGVSEASTIVLYDEDTGPLAGFMFWLLKYLGHRDVRVLNGGWHAWQRANGAVTREAPKVQPVIYTAHVNGDQRSNAEWIQEWTQRGDVVLLDARSDAEYYMGHIPGAVNLSYDEAIEHSTHQLKKPEELRQQFEAVGVTADKEVVTYCGSGSRSAHTYLVLKSLGYPRVRNYDGSMMDWSHGRHLPLE
jgi:thiosulfate/3-mercaptopyruvate sulfurtransferase